MSIEVHIRVRPRVPNPVWTAADTVLCSALKQETRFQYSRVYNASTSNSMIFHSIDPIIHAGFDGKNITVMAYGCTNAGKTYTMMGTKQDPGIIQKAADLLIQLRERHLGTSITASCIEIYNEQVKDLMCLERGEIVLRDAGEEGVQYEKATVDISSWADFQNVIETSERYRKYGVTDLNEHSSRSHIIMTFQVSRPNRQHFSVINLVDLAGSESASRANTEGSTLREGGFINRSLLSLGNVVDAIIGNRSHIPYRDSKLTRILRPCLGGQGFTFIICCINPSREAYDQTIATLLFTQRAMKIKKDPTVTMNMAPLFAHQYGRSFLKFLEAMDFEADTSYQLGVYETYQSVRGTIKSVAKKQNSLIKDTVNQLEDLQALLIVMDQANGIRHLRSSYAQTLRLQDKQSKIDENIKKVSRCDRNAEETSKELTEKKRRIETEYQQTKADATDAMGRWKVKLEDELTNAITDRDLLITEEIMDRENIIVQRHVFMEQFADRMSAKIIEALDPILRKFQAIGVNKESLRRAQDYITRLKEDVAQLESAYEQLKQTSPLQKLGGGGEGHAAAAAHRLFVSEGDNSSTSKMPLVNDNYWKIENNSNMNINQNDANNYYNKQDHHSEQQQNDEDDVMSAVSTSPTTSTIPLGGTSPRQKNGIKKEGKEYESAPSSPSGSGGYGPTSTTFVFTHNPTFIKSDDDRSMEGTKQEPKKHWASGGVGKVLPGPHETTCKDVNLEDDEAMDARLKTLEEEERRLRLTRTQEMLYRSGGICGTATRVNIFSPTNERPMRNIERKREGTTDATSPSRSLATTSTARSVSKNRAKIKDKENGRGITTPYRRTSRSITPHASVNKQRQRSLAPLNESNDKPNNNNNNNNKQNNVEGNMSKCRTAEYSSPIRRGHSTSPAMARLKNTVSTIKEVQSQIRGSGGDADENSRWEEKQNKNGTVILVYSPDELTKVNPHVLTASDASNEEEVDMLSTTNISSTILSSTVMSATSSMVTATTTTQKGNIVNDKNVSKQQSQSPLFSKYSRYAKGYYNPLSAAASLRRQQEKSKLN